MRTNTGILATEQLRINFRKFNSNILAHIGLMKLKYIYYYLTLEKV